MDLSRVRLQALSSQPTPTQIRQEVNALSVEQRAAIILVCVKGYSYQDAALQLGISPEMIRELLLRGRLTLIRKLDLKGSKTEIK